MKPFKDVDEQIKILKKRSLKFGNEEAAKNNLMAYGYYEIVNGYKDYLLESTNPEKFKDDATFEQLLSLYNMDKQLQEAVLNATLEYEMLLKTAMSYAISEKYTSDQNKYLDKRNYKTGKVKSGKDGKKYFEIDSTFIKFNKIINDDLEPFKHYRETHGNTPPWILFKGATLGNMMHFYKLQNSDIKNQVISIMFGIPVEYLEIDKNNTVRDLFSDLLSLCYKFRNRSAHIGRVYNYKAEDTIVRYNSLLHSRMEIDEADYRNDLGVNDLYTLYVGLSFLKMSLPIIKLSVILCHALKKHTEIYKQDRENILSSLGVPQSKINLEYEDIFKVIFQK